VSALVNVIVRHAEKPNEDKLGPGLTIKGVQGDMSLVVRG
jgi:hypothetical protein